MFQKLVRERPAMQGHWKQLLEEGCITTNKGSIKLIRRPSGDRTLLVKAVDSDLHFHITSGRLEITRGDGSDNPTKLSFRVSQLGSLDIEDLDPAFDKVEGFELAIHDLYKTVDGILEEYERHQPPIVQAKGWLSRNSNRIFLLALIVYISLTVIALFAH